MLASYLGRFFESLGFELLGLGLVVCGLIAIQGPRPTVEIAGVGVASRRAGGSQDDDDRFVVLHSTQGDQAGSGCVGRTGFEPEVSLAIQELVGVGPTYSSGVSFLAFDRATVLSGLNNFHNQRELHQFAGQGDQIGAGAFVFWVGQPVGVSERRLVHLQFGGLFVHRIDEEF